LSRAREGRRGRKEGGGQAKEERKSRRRSLWLEGREFGRSLSMLRGVERVLSRRARSTVVAFLPLRRRLKGKKSRSARPSFSSLSSRPISPRELKRSELWICLRFGLSFWLSIYHPRSSFARLFAGNFCHSVFFLGEMALGSSLFRFFRQGQRYCRLL